MAAQRDQIELRACDLDSLLGGDHAARTVWAFVQSLDLGPLHAKIKAVEHAAGRPAFKSRRCLIPANGFYEWQAPADPKAREQP